jgi:hypothetical protein
MAKQPKRERERDGKGSSSGGTGQDRRWHGELGHICMRRWYMEMWLPLMGEKGTSTTGRRPQPAKQRKASFAASLHVCVVLVVCPVSARSSFTSRLGKGSSLPSPPLSIHHVPQQRCCREGYSTQLAATERLDGVRYVATMHLVYDKRVDLMQRNQAIINKTSE